MSITPSTEGSIEGNSAGDLIELKQHMLQPPGCAFLGSKAMQTMASVGGLDEELVKVIIDSGSDITLILQKTLEGLKLSPRSRRDRRSISFRSQGQQRSQGMSL